MSNTMNAASAATANDLIADSSSPVRPDSMSEDQLNALLDEIIDEAADRDPSDDTDQPAMLTNLDENGGLDSADDLCD